MQRKLIRIVAGRQGPLRPAKVIALEARKEAKLEAERLERLEAARQDRERPRPAA